MPDTGLLQCLADQAGSAAQIQYVERPVTQARPGKIDQIARYAIRELSDQALIEMRCKRVESRRHIPGRRARAGCAADRIEQMAEQRLIQAPFQRAPIEGSSLVMALLRLQQAPKIGIGWRQVDALCNGFTIAGLRLGGATGHFMHGAQIVQRLGVIGGAAQYIEIVGFGCGQIPLLLAHIGQLVARLDVCGVGGEHLLEPRGGGNQFIALIAAQRRAEQRRNRGHADRGAGRPET